MGKSQNKEARAVENIDCQSPLETLLAQWTIRCLEIHQKILSTSGSFPSFIIIITIIIQWCFITSVIRKKKKRRRKKFKMISSVAIVVVAAVLVEGGGEVW